MGPTRTVHVDDTDPRFEFQGGWTAKQSPDSGGLSGPPFNLTIHETTTEGLVIFRFKNVLNLLLYGNVNTLSSRPKPSWSCMLDNQQPTYNSVKEEIEMSHYTLCTANGLDGGEHQLTVNVTIPSGGVIAIDAVELTPASGIEISEGEVLQIQDTDPAVTYEPKSSWELGPAKDGTHDTDIPSASVQIHFTGSKIQAAAVYQDNKAAGSGTYILDGGTAKRFEIPQVVSKSFHNIFLSEEGLSSASHNLNVTFTGESGQAPLKIGYFYVTLPPGKSQLVPSDKVTQPSGGKHSKSAGAIAGGAAGGVLGLVIIVVAFFLYRRHKRRQEDTNSKPAIIPIMEESRSQFYAGPSPPIITPAIHIEPPGSNTPFEGPANGKKGGPVILSYEPSQSSTRVDIQHEDSGYRSGNPSTSGTRGLEIRELPPVYSAV